MVERRLHVVTELPEYLTAYGLSAPNIPVFRRAEVYLCGTCGVILDRHVEHDGEAHRMIRCPLCGSLNQS